MLPTPIAHVIVVVQQHRTLDNLFACSGISGLDVVQTDPVSGHALTHISLSTNTGDIGHFYATFKAQYDLGAMDGFDSSIIACVTDAQTYWGLAQQYDVADEVFSAQESESFGATQFLIAGQSGGWYSADGGGAFSESNPSAGCGVSTQARAMFYNTPYPAPEPTTYPTCRDYGTIMDSATSWKFYTPANNTKVSGTDSVQHLYNAQHATTPETQFLTDIANGTLAEITYVVPSATNSDYPCSSTCSDGGPSWVTSIVRAVCNSSFWPTTTILLTWDQWGGWYDHVKPPVAFFPPLCGGGGSCNPLEAGFRTPLLAISPYARSGFISHTSRTQCAILGYIEATLQLPSLSTCDSYSNLAGGTDTLSDMFNYEQQPQPCIADPAGRRWL